VDKRKFNNLKAKWYKKLKSEGFEDIEKDEYNLKEYSSHFALRDKGRASNPIAMEARLEYYSMARRFLQSHRFDCRFDKRTWELHTDGIGIRVIAKRLRTYRRKVHETIQKLRKEMNGKT
jgi:hypothetical protein